MPRSATIRSVARAFRMMKAMEAQGVEWGEDYRHAAGAALKDVLEGRMAAGIDRHLADMAERGVTGHATRDGSGLARYQQTDESRRPGSDGDGHERNL